MSKHAAQVSAAIALALGAQGTHAIDQAPAGGSVAVTSCLDDGTPGTLRSVLASAPDHAVIDLSALACSTITLTQGELAFAKPGMQFLGPAPDAPGGAPKLTIDASYRGRAFNDTGDVLGSPTYFTNLRIANGAVFDSVYSAFGGCVAALSGVRADNVVFDNCEATGPQAAGGAIFAINSVTLQRSSITHSHVVAATTPSSMTMARLAIGGAIYSALDIRLYDSTISGSSARLGANGNNAADSYAAGGAIATTGAGSGHALVISGSTLSGNQSDQRAGALLAASGTVTITNSTLSANTAAFAGALDAHAAAALTLRNSTIAFNGATSVGGVYAPGGTVQLDSTIVSNNTASNAQFAQDFAHPPAAALTVQGANNLVTSWDASIAFAATPLSADPKLQPLALNGGPTMTHALPHDSPAIDAGNNVAALTYDQRGPNHPRVVNGAADIGAYEWLERIFADEFE